MAVESLNPKKYKEFVRSMQEERWRKATLKQLEKDFLMSGLPAPTFSKSGELAGWLDELTSMVEQLRNSHNNWENLVYRIDIPNALSLPILSSEEVARLFLLRCFQKVWLRNHFSSTASKDQGEEGEKHLKP